jgi:exonuclease VII small subunit
MKPSNELFDLVKSLTKSEKRYFKLSSSLQQGEKNYLQLFDAIEVQKEYDEEAIKKMFKGTTFIKHLPSEKNHLYSLLLKSLRGFHADKSANSQLQEYIKNIEVLYNKALYKECSKVLRKAKKMAYGYEKFHYLLELINWEKMLTEESYSRGKFNKNIEALVDEEHDVLEKLRNVAEYQILYSKINYVFRKGGYTRNAKERLLVDEISNHHLIRGKNTALSIQATTACYYIKGLCAWTNRDFKNAKVNFTKVIDWFEKTPAMIDELPKRYTRVLNGLLMYYITQQQYIDFFEGLEHLKSLATKEQFKSIDLQIRIFTFSRNAELLAYEAMGEFEKGEALVAEIMDALDKYQLKISKEDEILFYYNISRYYFGGAQYKKALEYINKVLNDNEGDLRQDIYTFARLLNLLIHYELKNFDLLDYIVKSTLRFIKKKQRNYQFENVFIKHIKRLVRANQVEKELQSELQQLKVSLENIFEDPDEQVVLEYIDVNSWINSKLEAISYADYKKKGRQS